MERAICKRLFTHGGSKAIDLPAKFVKRLRGASVFLEERDDCLIIFPMDDFETLESDPLFSLFIQALLADAMQHPDKLKNAHEIWDHEWDQLLEGVDGEEE